MRGELDYSQSYYSSRSSRLPTLFVIIIAIRQVQMFESKLSLNRRHFPTYLLQKMYEMSSIMLPYMHVIKTLFQHNYLTLIFQYIIIFAIRQVSADVSVKTFTQTQKFPTFRNL